jgi:hypothetical protein
LIFKFSKLIVNQFGINAYMDVRYYMKRTLLIIELVLIGLFSASCRKPIQIEPEKPKPQYDKPLPPGQLALRKITNPADIPDFTFACYDLSNLERAIDKSINYLKKPSAQQYYPYGDITREHAIDSLKAFKDLIERSLAALLVALAELARRLVPELRPGLALLVVGEVERQCPARRGWWRMSWLETELRRP